MEIGQEVVHNAMSLIRSRSIHDFRKYVSEQTSEPGSELNCKTSSPSKGSKRFKEIGSGSCGVIYDMCSVRYVLKKQSTRYVAEHTQSHILWHEFKTHCKVLQACMESNISCFSVPILGGYCGPNIQFKSYLAWWKWNGNKFPEGSREPSPLLKVERIVALPLKIRDRVLDLFCNPMVRLLARTMKRNRSCLMAPLLGSRRGSSSDGDHMRAYEDITDIRNFDLHVDQMETLHMDVFKYCKIYARALAIMHYSARLDANGVKFRLGSEANEEGQNLSDDNTPLPKYSPMKRTKSNPNPSRSGSPELAHLWLLDFDQCKELDFGPNLMNQAIQGFISNPKPYWPRPRVSHATNPADACYWKHFSREYVKFAKRFTPTGFPREFVKAIEQHYNQDDASQIVQVSRAKMKEDTRDVWAKLSLRKGDLLGDLHPDRYVQIASMQPPQLEYSTRLQLLRRGINLDVY